MTEVERWCRVTGVKHTAHIPTTPHHAHRTAAARTRSGGGGGKPLLIALAIAALFLAALTLAQAAIPTPTNRYIALDAGRDHTCTLHTTGRIHCWGNGHADLLKAPQGRYIAVSAGDWHNCAIRQNDNGITCWGRDSNAPDGAFVDVAVGGISPVPCAKATTQSSAGATTSTTNPTRRQAATSPSARERAIPAR